MSNQLYGPDGNPIPQDEEHTSTEQQNPQKDPKQPDTEPKDIPYPLQQPINIYANTHDFRSLPVNRGPLEFAALASGIVSIFMIGYTNYYTLFLMFAAGLSAILLGHLSLKSNKNSGRMPIAAMVMGALSVFIFLLTIACMIFLVNHPEFLEQLLQIQDQPIDIRDLL